MNQKCQKIKKKECLTIFVIGSSGDLARKKIFPSLFTLYKSNLLPEYIQICGYARSLKNHTSFRSELKPFLQQLYATQNKQKEKLKKQEVIDVFLSKCFYQKGRSYGDLNAYQKIMVQVEKFENSCIEVSQSSYNRLFYFAIPPNVFAETGIALKNVCLSVRGWNRIIIEKPFGRDLQSYIQLSNILENNFEEHQLFRIDHYLGKEMTQNMLILRFANTWVERILDRNMISSVLIEFRESIGTDGRGGYFDQYGIIRDIIQNHLLQLLTLISMECPAKLEGPGAEEAIRDSKVQILRSVAPIKVEDCILGQYDGYRNDQSIKDKQTNTATYAALCCYINTPRWHGVPFIIIAGKALNERKVEIRMQLIKSPSVASSFTDSRVKDNNLVIQIQPKPSISIETNVKYPGFSFKPTLSPLELNYDTYFNNNKRSNPDAYTRLLLDALKGKSGSFVRNDELQRSWEIFTPLLHYIEKNNIRPFIYKKGSNGPKQALEFVSKVLMVNASTVRSRDSHTPFCRSAL